MIQRKPFSYNKRKVLCGDISHNSVVNCISCRWSIECAINTYAQQAYIRQNRKLDRYIQIEIHIWLFFCCSLLAYLANFPFFYFVAVGYFHLNCIAMEFRTFLAFLLLLLWISTKPKVSVNVPFSTWSKALILNIVSD